MDIRGKAALITGGGSGIGRATALALAERGAARLHIVDRDEAGARETIRRLGATETESVIAVVDVADPIALASAFDAAEAAGGLEIVFNNAGMVMGLELFPDSSQERIQAIVAVNLTAVILGTQHAVRMMRRRGGGVVVNTASSAALHTGFRDYLYTATKAGVLAFSESCKPLAESCGVRVNTVLPGLVNTPILKTTGDGELADWMAPILANNVPLEPEAIAAAVIALIEDDSKAGERVVVAAS